MARTVVNLDETLLRRAMKLSGESRKVALVNWGLRVLVEHLEQREVRTLRGKIRFESDFGIWRGRR